MEKHKDLSDIELKEIKVQLLSWLYTGMRINFQRMPALCMLPHCYNPPSIAIMNFGYSEFPYYICDRCAKLAREVRIETGTHLPTIQHHSPYNF